MKPILADYLISLVICLLIFAGGFGYDYWDSHWHHPYNETINSYYHLSENIAESKKSGKYLGKYVYDSLHSENDVSYKADSELWLEKLSYRYYKETCDTCRSFVADSVFKDTILCDGEHFLKVLGDINCSLMILNKQNGDTLYSSTYYMYRLKHYPDTLLIIAKKNGPVYKGKICMVKE
jgi:hypothetical protein